MPSVVWETVGWIATVLLVGGYALVATRVLSAHSIRYHVLNLAGAIGLVLYSLYKLAWPQLALNLFWGGVAVIGIVVAVLAARTMRSAAAGAPQSGSGDEEPVREG
ncbi:MAG: hypothetical protein ACKOT0_09650 [bacterium]